MGIPWLLAFALRADGWYLRQDIIWHKTNAMPESVQDRCTKAHEYIFLLSKSAHYYFDAAAIREPCGKKGNARTFRGGGAYTGGRSFQNSARVERESHGNTVNSTGGRNKRSVWSIATGQFKAAHYATFPERLVEPCILAGCPEGGIVLDPFTGSGTTPLGTWGPTDLQFHPWPPPFMSRYRAHSFLVRLHHAHSIMAPALSW